MNKNCIKDYLPALNKKVIVIRNNNQFIATLILRSNKLYWKIDNINSKLKFKKYTIDKVEDNDCWVFYNSSIGNINIELYDLVRLINVLINDLNTKYESLGLGNRTDITENNKYQVSGVWGMVNIKILTGDKSKNTYIKLKDILKDYYKKYDVFICQYGTIMIKVRTVDFKSLKQ